ncbi:MAG: hypothetical protein SF070_16240 [Gemmatimonadota bacterium]|nr:hypothetical protein [Gemmatimonadota bacterium]
MTEPRSSPPWPVWALVTILVAAIPLAIELVKEKESVAVPPQGPVPAAVVAAPAQAAPAPLAQAEIPQLTFGTWTLKDAVDEQKTDWSNSTLKITSQTPEPSGLALTGVFEWRIGYRLYGVEQATGHYVASTRQLILEGVAIELRGDRQLGVGSYSAELSLDGRSLTNGRWGAVSGGTTSVAGTWRAER